MKNKMISYGLSAIVMLSVLAMATTVSAQPTAESFGVNDSSGATGTYVIVPVNITNAQNGPIISLGFNILYNNSVVNVVGCQQGDLTSNWDSPSYYNHDWGTRVTIVYDVVAEHAIQNGSTGSVVLLNFSVVGTAGSTSGMNLTGIGLSGIAFNVGTAPAKNGTFTVSIPAAIEYSTLNVTPTSGTAPLDITASATVENTGGVAGDYNATLKVDGAVVNYTTGTLDAGANIPVSLVYTLTTAGTYNVTIDELTATEVNVTPPPVPGGTVSIGSAACNVSDTVIVPISITNASNIGAMDITVTYNASVLNATGVANGSMMGSLPDLLWTYNLSFGRINISLATYPGMINGTGELFVVTFHADAVGNSTLDITVKEAWTADYPPQLVTPITVDGYVNVTGVLGDVTGDGNVNVGDVTYLARYLAELPGYTTTTQIADVTGDGNVNVGDVTYLARYLAELPGYTL